MGHGSRPAASLKESGTTPLMWAMQSWAILYVDASPAPFEFVEARSRASVAQHASSTSRAAFWIFSKSTLMGRILEMSAAVRHHG
jgi:hypothetical protein